MIDALMYAVRDGIRGAGLNYGQAECNIMDDERPPPNCGNYFASVHDGAVRSDRDNQLHEWYELSVTLTMRVTIALDRVGTQLLHRDIERVPLAERQGFWAKVDRLKNLIHMNWNMVVLTNQNPTSANDNLSAWVAQTSVNGFCEPLRFLSAESTKLKGGEWFGSDSEGDDEPIGLKSTLRFGKCRRFQPQTESPGPFV